MFLIKRRCIGEVLEQLYDSEVSFAMAWLWDAGVDYSLDNTPHPLAGVHKDIQSTGESHMGIVFGWIVDSVLKKYPKSDFSKWFGLHKDRLISKLTQ